MVKMNEKQMERGIGDDVLLPVLKLKVQNQLEKEFTDEDWFRRLYLGSIKTRFEICKDENGELRYTRAKQVTQVE